MTRYMSLESILDAGIVDKNFNPTCVEVMKLKFVEYVVGESLTCTFPVLPMYSNPRRVMQGGFIAAAFDNTFGTLIYFATKRDLVATIDLDVNFQNPIYENDTLFIKVYLKKLGKTMVYLMGEAFDSKNTLIATSTTNVMLLDERAKVYKG